MLPNKEDNEIISILNSKINIMILMHLARGPSYPRELARLLGKNESDISKRLRRMEKKGLVRGRWIRLHGKTLRLYSTNIESMRIDFKRGEITVITDNYKISRNILNLCNSNIQDPPKDFVGRSELLEKIRKNKGFIYVWGPPGIGKTSLVSKAMEQEEVIWHNAREWEGLTTLAKKLACFLASKGYTEVLDYLRGLEIDPEAFATLITKYMSLEDATIIIDDYHRAPARLVNFVEHLHANGYMARLIVISRHKPVGFWKRTLVLEVPPLTRKETIEFARINNLDFEEAWLNTRGHPGFLRLYSDIPNSYRESAIDYVISEVLNKLDEIEVDILILLATLPDPIDTKLLSRVFDRRINRYLYNLKKLGLIIEIGNEVTVPEFLKEILANPNNIGDTIRKLIHILIRGGWEDKLRAMRYSLLLDYNHVPAKIAAWRIKSNDYTYLYYLDSYTELIRATKTSGLDPLHLAYLLMEKSNVERQQGNYKKALEYADYASKICEATDDDACLADSLALYGYLKAFTGDVEDSIEILNRALYYARRSENPVSLYTTYSNLALAHSLLNDYETSYEYIKKEKDVSKKLNDVHALLMSDFHEAHILLFLSRLEEAEGRLAYISRIASQIGLLPVSYMADFLRAEVLIRMDRIEEAVSLAESAYEMGRRLGKHYATFARETLGRALLLKGDAESVLKLCETLPDIPTSILLCSIALARKGRAKEAMSRLKKLCLDKPAMLEGVISEFHKMRSELEELLEQAGCKS